MAALSSIALSGLQAAQVQLQASASNIANLSTPNYKRQQVVQSAQPGGGVNTQVQSVDHAGPALEADVVDQLQAKNAFLANLAVFRTADKNAGALFKAKA